KILSVGSFETLKHLKKLPLFLLFVPLFPYLLLRYSAGSHWFSGDYNYNLLKLPFNIVGNVSGYFSLALFGPSAMPFYNILRTLMRENLIIALAVLLIVVGLLGVSYRIIAQKMVKDEKRVVIFGMLFFLIALLPFLGLGNMTSRYSYLASVGFIIVFVYSMKKIHRYLQSSGSNIALMSMAVVISVFALFHIIQIQKINGDWRTAGEKVQNFFLAIDVSYQDYWSNEPMKFYFVNVPIRIGEAWAFPVGLSDALWFTFRNPAIAVYQMKSVEEAFDLIRVPKNEKVFVFDGNGSVTERSTNPLTDQ
ncbi:hypothetical protein HY468_05975, partial [Candidatus Roizmanbacteria bacterium]|nr:hypothetical protein [Candidatus Roizmanbacteria bacterium]